MEIHFKTVGTVTLGYGCGEGNSREACECDFIDADGTEYVVKQSINGRGRVNNLFEYKIYQHSIGTEYEKYYPIFKDITSDGKYLLVEKCVTALDTHEDEYDDVYDAECMLEGDPFGLFPDFMHHDLTAYNWGYTAKDTRPVIFDLGWSSDDLSSAAFEVGVPKEDVNELIAMEESSRHDRGHCNEDC